MTHDGRRLSDVKIGLDDLRQLFRHVRIHSVIGGPGFRRRVDVKSSAGAKIPRLVLSLYAWGLG